MDPLATCLAWIFPGGWEWILIAMIGLLLFGKRLPEVGKSLGKSIVEFKKGLKGVEDEIDRAVEADQSDMLPPPAESKPADSKSAESSTAESSTAEPSPQQADEKATVAQSDSASSPD